MTRLATAVALLIALMATAVPAAGKKIETPRHLCELLLARLLDCRRIDLYVKYEELVPEALLAAMRRGLQRIAGGEPVQYVTGQAGFHEGLFKVDSRALIPRPETELLVEQLLASPVLQQGTPPTIVDVGTGSGCIILSLAKARPGAIYIGIDISEDALALASENAQQLGIAEAVEFRHGELGEVMGAASADAIVANLPYIPTAVVDALPIHIREHEPRTALDGGPEGLDIIVSVIKAAGNVLKPAGMLFLEIGDEQGAAVVALMQAHGFADATVQPDLAGKDRVVCGRLAPAT